MFSFLYGLLNPYVEKLRKEREYQLILEIESYLKEGLPAPLDLQLENVDLYLILANRHGVEVFSDVMRRYNIESGFEKFRNFLPWISIILVSMICLSTFSFRGHNLEFFFLTAFATFIFYIFVGIGSIFVEGILILWFGVNQLRYRKWLEKKFEIENYWDYI